MQKNVRSRRARYSLTLAAAAAATVACGGGGSGGSTNATTTTTVPGAPTLAGLTAGNSSANVAFTAPASDGGSAITGYAATCTAGTVSASASGTASPLTVAGLSNGTAYTCSVTASNAVGRGAASGSGTVTPTAVAAGGGFSTASVLCGISASEFNDSASVRMTATYAWACSSTQRQLSSNGLPNHEVGTFPNTNNPNSIAAVNTSASLTLTPALAGTSTAVLTTGWLLNGVKMDPGTAGTCNDAGNSCSLAGGGGGWNIEALGQTSFNFGDDMNRAHVQPGGAYHYHGMPERYLTKLGKGVAMTLVGWAADGHPIYARYGYTSAMDAGSAVKVLTSSWRLKATPSTGRPATTLYPMGTFTQDYEYAAGSGDLDACNGRTGVTPEFPAGTYHYAITDTWPYIGRCVNGTQVARP
jgi:hypothetical protein